ncbi:ribosomal protein S18-alanine N-acetyltransferase [Lactovum odontotermitis]
MSFRFTNSREITAVRTVTESVFRILAEIYGHSPWSREQIMLDLAHSGVCYYFVYDDDLLVGFLATQCVLDELEITNLAVLPEYQRQGLASRLLANLADFHGILFLEVRVSNLSAQELYRKLGFTQFNHRKAYYSRPVEDALLLRRIQL